jgi:hypothetical protein
LITPNACLEKFRAAELPQPTSVKYWKDKITLDQRRADIFIGFTPI